MADIIIEGYAVLLRAKGIAAEEIPERHREDVLRLFNEKYGANTVPSTEG